MVYMYNQTLRSSRLHWGKLFQGKWDSRLRYCASREDLIPGLVPGLRYHRFFSHSEQTGLSDGDL